jgi:hypothetical protein
MDRCPFPVNDLIHHTPIVTSDDMPAWIHGGIAGLQVVPLGQLLNEGWAATLEGAGPPGLEKHGLTKAGRLDAMAEAFEPIKHSELRHLQELLTTNAQRHCPHVYQLLVAYLAFLGRRVQASNRVLEQAAILAVPDAILTKGLVNKAKRTRNPPNDVPHTQKWAPPRYTPKRPKAAQACTTIRKGPHKSAFHRPSCPRLQCQRAREMVTPDPELRDLTFKPIAPAATTSPFKPIAPAAITSPLHSGINSFMEDLPELQIDVLAPTQQDIGQFPGLMATSTDDASRREATSPFQQILDLSMLDEPILTPSTGQDDPFAWPPTNGCGSPPVSVRP